MENVFENVIKQKKPKTKTINKTKHHCKTITKNPKNKNNVTT